MGLKTDIWMPLYIGDYLKDTSRLNAEQHGGYLLLIMDYWVNGPLPDDDLILAGIAKMVPEQWLKNRKILAGFFEIGDGKWTHKRIFSELEKAEKRKIASRKNGRLGGRPKQ